VIDLTVVTNNQVTTFLTANSPLGFQCNGVDSLNFVTGLAPPPNIPTRSPTSAPTRSPAPTPDPEVTACALAPGILCQVLNGGGLLTCDNIAPPLNQECTSGADISELDFVYRGGGCTENIVDCVGSGADADEVWITIESTAQNLLWNQVTQRNDILNLRGIDEQMSVIINAVENGVRGEEILSYGILTNCTTAAGLKLKESYGPFELVEFTTREDGIVVANAALADVLITYDIELQQGTSTKAQITSATSTGGLISSQVTETYTPPAQPIGARSRHVFGTQSFLIDLIDGGNDLNYVFELQVFGDSASNTALPCNTTTTFEFSAN